MRASAAGHEDTSLANGGDDGELEIGQPVEPAEAFEVHIGVAIARIAFVPIVQPDAAAARPSLREFRKPYDDLRIRLGFGAGL